MRKTITMLAALAAATPALAQTDTTLPTTVDGETIIVTATRSGDGVPADQLGGSATVIDDTALQDRQTRDVSDVLRDVPGVAVSRAGAPGGLTQIRLRGSEANQTLVLIDGIEVSDPNTGEFDFGTLNADEAARIEVLRGQQSSLYGSDAIGGVINYLTLTGREAPGVSLRAEGGSHGTIAGGGRAAGVNGALDYAVSASVFHTDGYPVAIGGSRDVGSTSVDATAKASWTPSDTVKLTAVGRWQHMRADTDDQDGSFGSPTFGETVDSAGVGYRNQGLFGLVRGELSLLDGHWTNAITLQGADTQRTGYDVLDPYSPIAGQPVAKQSGDHGRRLKGSFESAYRFGSDAVKQTLTAALDAERESERTTVSPYGAFLGWRHTDNVGLVGEYELVAHDRLSLGASVRHDINNRFADPTTYRVQGSTLFGEGTRIHAAAGSGVKDPSFSDLFDYYAGRYIGNPDLKPEKSQGWEAGVEQAFLARRIVLDATFFHNHLTNEIGTTYTSDGSATPYNMAGHTLQDGLELSASAQLGSGFRIDAAYTRLHAPQDRFVIVDGVDTTFNRQAVRRAKDIGSASLDWSPTDDPFGATATVRYNGPQNDLAYTDPSYVPLLARLHGFTLVNLDARYRIGDHLELFGRVENLLDRRYQEVFSYRGEGRTAIGGVRVTL